MDTTQIKVHLAAHGYLAILWPIDDVRAVRPDLTEVQCKDVLQACTRRHDVDIGINWDEIRLHADDLFPLPQEAGV